MQWWYFTIHVSQMKHMLMFICTILKSWMNSQNGWRKRNKEIENSMINVKSIFPKVLIAMMVFHNTCITNGTNVNFQMYNTLPWINSQNGWRERIKEIDNCMIHVHVNGVSNSLLLTSAPCNYCISQYHIWQTTEHLWVKSFYKLHDGLKFMIVTCKKI